MPLSARSPSLGLLSAVAALWVASAACDEDEPKRPAVAARAPAAAPEPDAGADADAGAPKPESEVPGLLASLRGTDPSGRQAALGRLRQLAYSDALTGVDEVELLRAAAEEWASRAAEIDPGVLVELANRKPRPTFVPVVQRVFPKLNTRGKQGALELLAKLDDDHAAAALMSLLAAHADELPELSLAPLRRSPHHAQIFFPALLDYAARDDMAWEVWLTALSYCQAGSIGEEELRPYAPHMLAVYRRARAKLLVAQRRGFRSCSMPDSYGEHRGMAQLLLSLFAYAPHPDVEPELRRALAFQDPRLLLFAAASLLHRGEKVPQAVIERLAASPDTRNSLYRDLLDVNVLDRFPERHATQLAFAESEMVQWLMYPAELGCAPDEIVLGKIVSVDSEAPDGPLDFYVFRFRTRAPHWSAGRGWMAGVAGPFLRKDAPTVEALGSTSSDFEAWSSRTPDEHAGNVQQAVQDYKARREADEEAAKAADESEPEGD